LAAKDGSVSADCAETLMDTLGTTQPRGVLPSSP